MKFIKFFKNNFCLSIMIVYILEINLLSHWQINGEISRNLFWIAPTVVCMIWINDYLKVKYKFSYFIFYNITSYMVIKMIVILLGIVLNSNWISYKNFITFLLVLKLIKPLIYSFLYKFFMTKSFKQSEMEKKQVEQEKKLKNDEKERKNSENFNKNKKSEDEFIENLDFSNPWLKIRIKEMYKKICQRKILLKDKYNVNEKKNITEDALQEELLNISNHMGVKKFPTLHIVTEDTIKKINGLDYAGYYSNDEITIKKKLEFQHIHYVAILAHELTHHFMDENNFNYVDKDWNEKNTEILCIFLGFGDVLIKAYDINKEFPLKLGYLDIKEIKYINSQMNNLLNFKLRKKILNEKLDYLEKLYQIIRMKYNYFVKEKIEDIEFEDLNILGEIASLNNENNSGKTPNQILAVMHYDIETEYQEHSFRAKENEILNYIDSLGKWNECLEKYLKTSKKIRNSRERYKYLIEKKNTLEQIFQMNKTGLEIIKNKNVIFSEDDSYKMIDMIRHHETGIENTINSILEVNFIRLEDTKIKKLEEDIDEIIKKISYWNFILSKYI